MPICTILVQVFAVLNLELILRDPDLNRQEVKPEQVVSVCCNLTRKIILLFLFHTYTIFMDRCVYTQRRAVPAADGLYYSAI